MAATARFVRGDAKPRTFKASASYPFKKGDLLYIHPADNTLRRSSDLTAQGTAALGQLAFAQYFVGVAGVSNGVLAGEKSYKANDNFESEVLVNTGGIWEFDCPSQEFTNGQGVGIYATAGGLCSSPQKVDSLKGAAALSQRIGVAVPSVGALQAGSAGSTRVHVEIQSAYLAGGVPAAGSYAGTSGQ